MGKIDFKKVEEQLSNTIHNMFINNLMDEKPTLSSQLIDFFQLDEGSRPSPIDPVELALLEMKKEYRREMKKNEELSSLLEQGIEQEEAEAEVESMLEKSKEDFIYPNFPPPPLPPQDDFEAKNITPLLPSPLLLLNNHIEWFKRRKIKKVYTQLGTKKSEIKELNEKKVLNESDKKRIKELLEKAEDLKEKIFLELELDDDDTLIEKEKKKHKNKRFNVREDWLPLQ